MSVGDKKDDHSNSLGLRQSLFILAVPVCFFFLLVHSFTFKNVPVWTINYTVT